MCEGQLYAEEVAVRGTYDEPTTETDYCSESVADSGDVIIDKLTGGKRTRSKRIPTSAETFAFPANTQGIHRCVIFAQHRRCLDLIEELVLKSCFPQVPYLRMDGSTDASTRGRIAAEFNECYRAESDGATSNLRSIERIISRKSQKCDFRILLVTTRSCGVGLNLTAADTVIFVQHDWNPFVDLQVRDWVFDPSNVYFVQAMDRCHRLGQIRPVTVYRLLAESTIESRIASIRSFKTSVAEEVINEYNISSLEGSNLWNSLVENQNSDLYAP